MEVADILARKCKDPRLQCVTVTDVEMNNDLHHARVYVSLLGQDAKAEAVLKTLRGASGFVRSELGRRLDLRYTPEVTFWFDVSGSRAAKIERLLDDVLPVVEDGAAREAHADGASGDQRNA